MDIRVSTKHHFQPQKTTSTDLSGITPKPLVPLQITLKFHYYKSVVKLLSSCTVCLYKMMRHVILSEARQVY